MQRGLVERAIDGDHEAFAELARNSIARLYATARLILRDEVRAEDATQEALVAAWRDLSGLRDPDRFDAWLHRLLVRACYREARKARSRGLVGKSVLAFLASSASSGGEAIVQLPIDGSAPVVINASGLGGREADWQRLAP